MRVTFHGELQQLGGELALMCRLAGDAMEHAARALLRGDLVLAERVITEAVATNSNSAASACRVLGAVVAGRRRRDL